jgi:hypothetical protein
MVHRRSRALDEPTAKHTRLAFSGVIKHAGLPRRYAMFAVHQFDLATRGAMPQPGCLGGTRRTDFNEHFAAVIGKRFVERAISDPVYIAQHDPTHAQRFTRTNDDTPTIGIKLHHVKRRTSRNTETAALAHRKMNDAGMWSKHLPVEIHDIACFRCTRLQPFDHVGIVTRRHKADVLAVVFVGNSQTEATSELASFCLGSFTKRKAQGV